MFNPKRLFTSFLNALAGFWAVVREEQSFRIQLVAAVIVLVLIVYFPLEPIESAILILLITIVLVLELVNSVFERMIDVLRPRLHHYVRDIKNIMAAAVFIASLGAAIIGIIILYPYL